MSVKNVGTHVTHCCGLHGCKYGHAECPVETGELFQSYPCQDCSTVSELEGQLSNLEVELDFMKALKARQQ